MTTHDQATGRRAARWEEVDGVVRAAEETAPDHAYREPLRHALGGLRQRLRDVHSACEQTDDAAWAEYVDGLDRGLDELAIELGRAGEDAAGPEQVLFVHTTRLEIDGWVLRLDHARDDGQVAARSLAGRAWRDLAAYERGETTRRDVEPVVDDVRTTAAT